MMINQIILKGVLLLRKVGNTYQTKDEQIAEQLDWFEKGYTTKESLESWIEDLKAEIAKTPEQKEQESQEMIEWLCECDAKEAARDDEYFASATAGDYGPSNPWDAPGMSIRDFF